LAHLLSILVNGSDIFKGLLSVKIFVGGVFIYLIILSFFKKNENTGWIIYSLVFFATALSIILIIKYTVGYDESDNLTKDMVDIGWGRSNYLASFLAFFIPISLGLAILEKALTTRVIFIGCFLLMLLTLVVTMSKGAGLSLAIVLFIVLPLLLKTKVKIKYLVTLISIIVCAYYLTPKIMPESLITMNTQYIEYRLGTPDDTRIQLLQTSWEDFIENPLLGIGPYESKSLSSKYEIMPHNFIAQLFAELGLLGAIPFMLIIFIFLFRAYKNCSYSGNAEDYFILAGVIGTLIHGLFELTFQGAQYMSVFWVLMAAITLKYRQSRANFQFKM
jgi:O-antigen ligase